MNEVWCEFPGWEGSYEISSLGRVRSLDRTVVRHGNGRKIEARYRGKLMKRRRNPAGYPAIRLSLDGSPKDILIHSAVCSAFHGARPDGFEAAHLDGFKENCASSNLAWKRPVDNTADKWAHGTMLCGERHGRSKLSSDQIREIRQATGTQAEIAARYGIAQGHVSRIKNSVKWKHLGPNTGGPLEDK